MPLEMSQGFDDSQTSFSEVDPNGGQSGGSGSDWIAALIAAGASIYSASVANKNNKRTIEANKQQAEYAYSKELEMWNRQNDYNNPLAVMNRLKAAGLNPNLIYGSGSGAGGQASQMPKYNAPTLQYNQQPIVNVPEMMGIYQNFAMKQAQINNVKAQTDNINTKTATEAARTVATTVAGKILGQKHDFNSYNMPYQSGILGNRARQSSYELEAAIRKLGAMDQESVTRGLQQEYLRKQMKIADIEAEKREAQAMWEKQKAEWAKMGVTSGDHVLLRMFVRMKNEAGF